MMKIWAESVKFDKSQRLSNQATMILKKGFISDCEILEIYGQVNREKYDQRELCKLLEILNIKTKPSKNSAPQY